MPRTFFISDTHFNHRNILKYEPIRVDFLADYMVNKGKYGTFEEAKEWIINHLDNYTEEELKELLTYHNNMIIEKWNKKVSSTDTVWFLGDFGFGNKDTIKELISKLKGRKRMIKGNHDNFPKSFWEENGFEYVSNYPIVIKDFFILSHAPLQYFNGNTPYFNIYGHVHSSEYYQTRTEHTRCVCVERQNFEPIEIEEFNNYQPNNEKSSD